MYTYRTTVYLSDRDKDLKILDCSDPYNIQDHGFVNINAADIFFSNDVAYMARGMSVAFQGMTVYDFSDRYTPRRTGFLPISGYFTSPTIMGDNLVVHKVIMENKIAFYNLSIPNSPQKLGCINLTDEPHAAGVYLTRWDGRSETGKTVASGLYIARLEAGDHRSMIKMLLVR